MRNRVVAVALLAFAALPLSAQDVVDEVEDTDGNGVYSLSELQAAYPDLTAEDFAQIDGDGDGSVSEEELAIAEEDG